MKKAVKKVNKPKTTEKKKAEKKKPKSKTTKKSSSKKTTTKKKEEKKITKKKLVVKNPLRDEKVLKEVIQQSTKASEVLSEVKNDVIAKKEELKRKIEQFQEEIKNARENGEEACDISNMVIECNRYRDELHELERGE